MARHIDGKKFTLYDAHRTKTNAQKAAKDCRSYGDNARVKENKSVPRGGLRWEVWTA